MTRRVDGWLLFSALTLLVLGWLMVTSASMEVAGGRYGNPFYFSLRHGIYVLMGLGLGLAILLVPMNWWFDHGFELLMIAFLLLMAVLVPGIGREVNGSSRWIALGIVNLQASEVAKLFMVVYLAGYLVRRLDEVRERWSGFIKPLAVMVFMGLLLIMEPDYGATMVILGSMLGMLFLSGVGMKRFLLLLSATISMAGLIAILQPYRMKRLVTYFDPWAAQFDSGYQLTQALIAFGRGGWSGLGLGNSVQKLFYLPEAHTDFVFAILAEELGLIGALLTLLLYSLVIYRMVAIARRAGDIGLLFHCYVGFGLALVIAAQTFINIGVNTGLLPTKGLTLPFMSYGGSSLLISCVMVAIALRIDLETRVKRQQNSQRRGTYAQS
ncbi:putative lipid II flippase FtsW [Oceanospirillum multiglobuliferum]|uniref:Probable peptidoglycan glycosyltransferase FtsW n=2 Tax=Oceanospirillum multiglobuliferum TaxID=64969 RepID=A0A1V4T6C7_9GAMM|nr:putative lipid II flippase FtsW [Oceanospirillum multiglobuliferum]